MEATRIGEFILKYFVLISLVISVVSGVIGFFVKIRIDRKKELLSQVNIERREAYQGFINLVIGLFANLKTEKKRTNNEFVSELYEFYKKNLLYASPKVVIKFADYMQFLYHYDQTDKENLYLHIGKLTDVMKAMREDLGLSNKNLGKHGEILMKAIIKDFKTMSKKKITVSNNS